MVPAESLPQSQADEELVIVLEKKDENGSSTNTTENFIAEKIRKFVIPVPGACK